MSVSNLFEINDFEIHSKDISVKSIANLVAKQNAVQSIINSGIVAVKYQDVIVDDLGTFIDTSYTVAYNGIYAVSGFFTLATGGTGNRQIYILKNSDRMASSGIGTTTVQETVGVSSTFKCDIGDVIKIGAAQGSTGPLNTVLGTLPGYFIVSLVTLLDSPLS